MEETKQEYMRLKEVFQSFMPYLFAAGRVESFTKKWPYKSPNLSPQKMADAGFMYSPDPFDPGCVKCPFCLKELSSWEDDDNPMYDIQTFMKKAVYFRNEHRRYKSRCYFARLNKSEEQYTVRDVLLLVTNTRAALLVKYWLIYWHL
uniref:Baculoviral IAP repeat-containing protein 3-like n=1 Tax=Syphacia muris TaxID=451379 RepID=A0A0N5AV69_9BILA